MPSDNKKLNRRNEKHQHNASVVIISVVNFLVSAPLPSRVTVIGSPNSLLEQAVR